MISLELLFKNASRLPLSATTMIMVVQPIIIIFQNRGQDFYGYLVGATDNCHYFPTIIVSANWHGCAQNHNRERICRNGGGGKKSRAVMSLMTEGFRI